MLDKIIDLATELIKLTTAIVLLLSACKANKKGE